MERNNRKIVSVADADITVPKQVIATEERIFFGKYMNCNGLSELKRAYDRDLMSVEDVDYKSTREGIIRKAAGCAIFRHPEWWNTGLSGNEYQKLAARTMNRDLENAEQEYHALHGMAAEIGEIHSIYQKSYQGHPAKTTHLMKEVGDLLWFIAEFCTAMNWNLEDVMLTNIDKLESRYPEGFNAEYSLNRKEGDI